MKSKLKEYHKEYLETDNQRLFRDKINPELEETFAKIQNKFDIGHLTEVPDIRQECIIRLLEKVTLVNIDSISNFDGYIYRMFVNTMYSHFKKHETYKKYLKRLKIWMESTGQQWNSSYKFNEEDTPQGEHITENVVDNKTTWEEIYQGYEEDNR
jgi:DNA-directed RNA polymerase specialized sigma24 family protein